MGWKPVVGFEGYYEVSDSGDVRSLRTGKIMATHPAKNGGHLRLRLTDGVRKRRVFVHVLVLEAFVGPRPDGAITRHLDGDPTNNRLDNLAWGTPRENNQDTLLHGRHKGGAPRRERCKRGHLLTPENTGVWKDQRRCLACSRARAYIKYHPESGTIEEVADRYYLGGNHGS